MNSSGAMKLQHLRFGFSLSRSNWTRLPTPGISEASLIQRYAISSCRVSACGGCFKFKFVGKPQKAHIKSPTPQKSPTILSQHANGNKSSWSSSYRPKTLDQIIPDPRINPLESWRLWQTKSCSIKDIVQRRGLSEFEVYEQICECVQQGKVIDWFDLMVEAEFSAAIVLDINHAKAEAEEATNKPLAQHVDEFGCVPVQCGPHVTDVHVLLYNTMMACGITPHEMFPDLMKERPSHQQQSERMATPNPVASNWMEPSGSKRVAAAAPGDIGTPGSKFPDVKLTSSETTPPTEDADPKKAPKRLTQKHMLQWMTERNGATLLELVQEFQGYNECQLMRLILLLERKKLIDLRQGIFRVTSSPDDEELTL